jgi:hypothetical protein
VRPHHSAEFTWLIKRDEINGHLQRFFQGGSELKEFPAWYAIASEIKIAGRARRINSTVEDKEPLRIETAGNFRCRMKRFLGDDHRSFPFFVFSLLNYER